MIERKVSEDWRGDVVPRFAWKVVVSEGAEILHGYGVAWRCPGTRSSVCMPLGVNILARALREFFYWMLAPKWGMSDRAAYARHLGWKEGFAAGQKAAYREWDRDEFGIVDE